MRKRHFRLFKNAIWITLAVAVLIYNLIVKDFRHFGIVLFGLSILSLYVIESGCGNKGRVFKISIMCAKVLSYGALSFIFMYRGPWWIVLALFVTMLFIDYLMRKKNVSPSTK